MLNKLLGLFRSKRKSHARKLFEELEGAEKQFLMPGCDPIKYKLDIEIPKFTHELAKLTKRTTPEYIEYLLVESLYANRLQNSIKMDGYMPSDVSYRKPPKLYN